jgi:hypothetical protein
MAPPSAPGATPDAARLLREAAGVQDLVLEARRRCARALLRSPKGLHTTPATI